MRVFCSLASVNSRRRQEDSADAVLKDAAIVVL